MIKSYAQLSKEIDDNLRVLADIVYKQSEQYIVDKLKALEDSVKELRATYK